MLKAPGAELCQNACGVVNEQKTFFSHQCSPECSINKFRAYPYLYIYIYIFIFLYIYIYYVHTNVKPVCLCVAKMLQRTKNKEHSLFDEFLYYIYVYILKYIYIYIYISNRIYIHVQ